MPFQSRADISRQMSSILNDYLKSLGFVIQELGYEHFFDEDLRKALRNRYDSTTYNIVRFIPDYFIYLPTNGYISLIEYKICNTPLYSDNRVRRLIELSGDNTLTKDNVGAIESASIDVYKKLTEIGVDIIIVVFSRFHKKDGASRCLISHSAKRLTIIHQDKVIYGTGDASRTPYTNINLDEFTEFDLFLRNECRIEKSVIYRRYADTLSLLVKNCC